MGLKIVCFEDSHRDRDKLLRAFRFYEPEFKFFVDPQHDWEVTTDRAREIKEFNPTLIIVDLKDDKGRRKEAGLRIIRQLNDFFQDRYPLIAWSVLLGSGPGDRRYINYVLAGGAKPLYKSKNRRPTATRFLSLANVQI
jgi:hypothetical protein